MTKPKHPSMLKGKTSKLTKEDVVRIRALAAEGLQTVKEMSAFYKVGAETIRRAIRGETWNDLGEAKTEAELEEESQASLARMQTSIAAARERNTAGDKLLDELNNSVADKAAAYGVVKRA